MDEEPPWDWEREADALRGEIGEHELALAALYADLAVCEWELGRL